MKDLTKRRIKELNLPDDFYHRFSLRGLEASGKIAGAVLGWGLLAGGINMASNYMGYDQDSLLTTVNELAAYTVGVIPVTKASMLLGKRIGYEIAERKGEEIMDKAFLFKRYARMKQLQSERKHHNHRVH